MTDAKPNLPANPISELVTDPGFPSSAVGKRVNNANDLRKIYRAG